MKDTLLKINDVAKYLKRSVQTVYRMIDKGEIPFTKIGGGYRFRQKDIDEWMSKQTEQTKGKGKANESH